MSTKKTRPFLITGFPRCRTAWLSALCNTVPGAICRHEPTAERPWRDCLPLFHEPEFSYAGISDPAMGFHLREILVSTLARVLIVRRDALDVETSLAGIGIYGDMQRLCRVLEDEMEPFLSHPEIMSVDFDDLSDDACVAACLRHLMPGAVIRMAKIREMQHMNVQADPRRAVRLAEQRGPSVGIDTFGERGAGLLS